MSIFRLDRDTFDRQLAAMEANGQAFEEAQSAFAVAAHSAAAQLTKSHSSGASGTSSSSSSASGSSGSSGSGGMQWSGIGELDQFGSPLQAAAVMVDARMASASRLEKKGVADMRASLASFAALNESEKQAYLARLTALDERFTYRRPEEMASIVQAYDQTRTIFDALSKWGGK